MSEGMQQQLQDYSWTPTGCAYPGCDRGAEFALEFGATTCGACSIHLAVEIIEPDGEGSDKSRVLVRNLHLEDA